MTRSGALSKEESNKSKVDTLRVHPLCFRSRVCIAASPKLPRQELADSVAVRLNLGNGLAPGSTIFLATLLPGIPWKLVRKSFGDSPSKR